MSKYRLKLKRLDFISPVDAPAQETAKVLLIKREGALEGQTASVVKISEELGLVFCWAFTSKSEGADYFDLHGDNIAEDFVKAAADFMQSGGLTDEMHDGEPDGRVVFAMPMTAEIAKAFGVTTDTEGLMVALKPSADVMAKFKAGEYTGVSIAGLGERIEARAPAKAADEAKSTQAPEPIDPVTTTEKSTMATESEMKLQMKVDDLTTQVATLTKQLERAQKLSALPETQRDYYKRLGADAQEVFLAKSAVEREVEVAPVYTSKSDGTVYRKSDDPRLVEMAKRQDAVIEQLKQREDSFSKNEIAALTKSLLGNLPGEDEVHKYIVKAIRSGGGDAAMVEHALESLRGANEAARVASVAKGFTTTEEPIEGSLEMKAETLARKYATENKVDIVKARGLIWDTPEGTALYAAMEKRRQQAARG